MYDGEYEVEANYTQSDLEAAIDNGEFTLHKVGDQYRVLVDINSLVTVEAEKGQEFKSNQTIRVIDQAEEIVVEQGNDKKTVVVNGKIKPINAMEKLYMTIVVQ